MLGENRMEKLLSILRQMAPDVDFQKEENLIDDGILASLQIMSLVVEINDEFDVEITPFDIIPENFKSAKSMLDMIIRLQNED